MNVIHRSVRTLVGSGCQISAHNIGQTRNPKHRRLNLSVTDHCYAVGKPPMFKRQERGIK